MSKKNSGIFSKIRGKIKSKSKEGALLCVLLATMGGIAVMFLLMLLFAAALSCFPLPLSVFSPAGLLIGCLSAMSAGFLCALMSREKGFFFGIFCGMILFVILLLVALLVWKQKLGTYTLVKLFAMLLSGAIGGIIGVNRN